ncbi:GNAT family N-acetyltransferase [Clostridium sp. CTA-19]
MILKLDDSHNIELLNFLKVKKELNLFMISDLENYGFNKDFLEYWGEFDENYKLIAVLMRFYEDFTIYSKEEFDVLGFSKIIKKYNFKLLGGERKAVEKFGKYINAKEKRNMYFAKLDKNDDLYKGELLKKAIKIEVKDAVKILELHEIINDGKIIEDVKRFQKKFIDKTGRGYYLLNNKNKVVCSAETTAENSYSAMIVGVCTHIDYRGCGYATALVSKLCIDLLLEGKTVCLFYDNPIAGKIYKNIGFIEIGFWSLWKSEKC